MYNEGEYKFILNTIKYGNELKFYTIRSLLTHIIFKEKNLILKTAEENGDVRLYKNEKGEKCVEYIKGVD